MCFFVHWAGSCCRWLLLLALAAGSCCRWLLLLAPAAALAWFCCSFDGFLLPRSSFPLPSSSFLFLFSSASKLFLCAKLFPFLFLSLPFSLLSHIQVASQCAPSHTGASSTLHDSTLGHSTVSRSPLPTKSEGCPFPRCNGEFRVCFSILLFLFFPFLLLLLFNVCIYIYIYT